MTDLANREGDYPIDPDALDSEGCITDRWLQYMADSHRDPVVRMLASDVMLYRNHALTNQDGDVVPAKLDTRTMTAEIVTWAKEKGWHMDGRTVGDHIALMHSELSEALEAYRVWGMKDMLTYKATDGSGKDVTIDPIGDATVGKYLNSDQVGKPEGVASELADTLIRILHFCGEYGIDLGREVRKKMTYNWTRTHRHGGKAL